jgi:Spy/CpxP family protein refolding chaperone
MTRLVPVAAIVLGAATMTSAPAQQPDSTLPGKLASRQTEMMKGDLDLTAEQVPRVEQINQAEMSGFQQIMSQYKSNPSADRKGLIQEAVAVSKTRDTQLQKVLTPQQWHSYQAKKPERTAENMTRLMTVQLDLTSDQVPGVDQANLTATRAMRTAMGDHFQEKPRREKIQIARMLKEIGEKRDQRLQQILRKDQWEKYEKNKEEMKEVMKERIQERNG